MTVDSYGRTRVTALKVFHWLDAGAGQVSQLEGSLIQHFRYGAATIEEIDYRDGQPRLNIQFVTSKQRRSVPWMDLRDVRTWDCLFITSALAQSIISIVDQIRLSPDQVRYRDLCERFQVKHERYSILRSERSGAAWSFFDLLIKIENEPQWVPRDETFRWLRKRQMFGVLALLYSRRFSSTRDAWDAAKASKCWRILRQPSEAVSATDEVAAQPRSFHRGAAAAALISRSAALREVQRFTESEEALRTAMQLGGNQEYLQKTWGALNAVHDD
jgi:hypothetical protein